MASSPHALYGVSAAAVSIGAAAALEPYLSLLWAWLAAVSIVTMLLHGYDKMIAGSGITRVPENVVLAFSAAGGSVACFVAMLLFRHKTQKSSFQGALVGILILQGVILYAVL